MNIIKHIKRSMILFSIVSIVSLCAMENKKSNVISDAELLARKKAFALQFKNQNNFKRECLMYPENSNVAVDLKVLNKDLELEWPIAIWMNSSNTFIIPEGMDEKFIHSTLVPKRSPVGDIALVNF